MAAGKPLPDTPIQDIPFARPDGVAVPFEVGPIAAVRARRMSHSIYRPTRLNFHIIQLVHEGQGQHFVDFESVPIQSGNLLHIRPGQIHAFDQTSDYQALAIMFLPEGLANPLPLSLTHPYRPRAIRPEANDFALLMTLAGLLGDLSGHQGAIQAHELGLHLLNAVIQALEAVVKLDDDPERSSAATPTIELVRNFERLLEQRFENRHQASWYAEQLDVSLRTLARACDTVLNTTPKRHIDARVALEAKRRLTFSPISVDALSFQLGFTEATNFVKFFQRAVGESPSAFRNRSQSNHG